LFTPEIFTDEVLKQLDEAVIKPHFILPDIAKDDILSAFDDVEEDTDAQG
jgi:hypothetical protein